MISGRSHLAQNVLANQNGFQELAEQCQMVSLVVYRATSGMQEHKLNHTLKRALYNLKSSVDDILRAVEAKTKKNGGSKIFHATLDQETILFWKNELGRVLNLFNTEVNISTNLKLHELLALLPSNLEKSDTLLPEVPPAPPKIFVGRDDLVRSTIQRLLQCRYVALIGPGGIGKSSIARAVLNDKTVAAKFHERRFFIRYDNVDATQITFEMFLNQIARALGLPTSVNAFNLIHRTLLSSEILLVLDNAESFLDAAVGASRIADAIDGFGARPTVTILLTTRTTVLPPNLGWFRLQVPALEEGAACEAFKLIYSPSSTPSMNHSIPVKLLSALDFHPLSINLLAQVAVQNNWSTQDLVDAWGRQRLALLKAGDGKVQSIAVTIETSLQSPSIIEIGDTIRHLLQILAFLPQGIRKKQLTTIFPGVSNIESCADILCRHSLAYLNGSFIALLAPIRLYISEHDNVHILENPLLEKVRQYYAAHVDEEEVVCQDDVNMEHVFSHWVVDPKCMVHVLKLISDFVYTLLDCRPRPISLCPVINALDPQKSRHDISWIDSLKVFRFGQSLRKLQVSLEKGSCLFAISTLLRWIGQKAEAKETFANAQEVLLETRKHGRARLIGVDWAVALIYIEQSNYQAAEKLLRTALKRLSDTFRPNRDLQVLLRFGLAQIKMFKGDPHASEDFFEALLAYRTVVEDPNVVIPCYCEAGYAQLHDGHLDTAKRYFEEAKAIVDEDSIEGSVMSLLGSAEMADYEGDHTEAKLLRAQALEIIQKMPDHTVAFVNEMTAILAGYLAMEGDAGEARKLIIPAVANASKYPSQHAVRCKYIAGMIYLIDRDFDKARNHFQETVEECVSVEELRIRALSERALGEVAVVEGDLSVAKKRFEVTTDLCKEMGIQKECLYRNLKCYIPNDTFNGWKLYQEGNVAFRD
ncbi:hypothetical protein C0989_012183 [Termitomyces sp. Mn162]|nr:hypothetical protein C0989_012183 [Termitomyces sp. Mn162]